MENKKKTFAKGICFYKLFIIFIIASFLGSIYEELLHLFRFYMNKGIWDWSLRRGVIYGPFNIIYGFGAAAMVKILVPKTNDWRKVFVCGSLLGGIIEYGLSFLQQTFVGTVSWDYSDKFLNINGRTTIPYMMFWGLLALLLVYLVYPFISKMIERIPIKIGEIGTKILVVFMAIDMLLSFTAVIRQNLRHKNIPAYTIIGRLCDKYYPDEFLKKYYPNMQMK